MPENTTESAVDNHPAVDRVRAALAAAGVETTIVALPDAARTAPTRSSSAASAPALRSS
jgi:hypothetical protein